MTAKTLEIYANDPDNKEWWDNVAVLVRVLTEVRPEVRGAVAITAKQAAMLVKVSSVVPGWPTDGRPTPIRIKPLGPK